MIESDKVKILAVEDISKELAKKVSQKYGLTEYTNSEDELLKNDNIQAVYIGTPVFAHAKQAKKRTSHFRSGS